MAIPISSTTKNIHLLSTHTSSLASHLQLTHLLIAIFLSLLFLPNILYKLPSNGIDPSYDIAIAEALYNNYIFGTQIIFPYGPLGYLHTKLPFHLSLLPILLNTLGIFIGTILINYLFLNSYDQKNRSYLLKIFFQVTIITLLSLQFNLLGESLEVSISWGFIGLFCLHHTIKVTVPPLLNFLYRLLACLSLILASLIKINSIPIVVLSIFLILLISLIDFSNLKINKNNIITGFLSIFIASLLSILFISNLNIDLKEYLLNSFELLINFDSSMYLKARDSFVYLENKILFLGYSFIFSNILLLVFIRKNIFKDITTSVFCCILTFLLLKSSITRADAHLNSFILLGWFPVVLLIYSSNLNFIKYLNTALLIIFITIFTDFKELNLSKLLNDKQNFASELIYATSSKDLERIATHFPLSEQLPEEIIKEVNSSTTDIFPWSISKLFQSAITYLPRPLLQSYHAYSPKLDLLDAKHFKISSAPEKLIFTHETLDKRYLLWDTPQTLAIIRSAYTPILYKNNWFLAERSRELKNTAPLNKKKDSKIFRARFNSWIKIPDTADNLNISLDIEYSIRGLLRKFFYKPSSLKVYFKLADGTEITHRAIKQMLFLQLPISYYIANTKDLYDYMSYNYQNLKRIKEFKITANKSIDFKPEFNVAVSE